MPSPSLERFCRTHVSLAALAAVGIASSAQAQGFAWSNVRDYPISLTSSADTWAWSAIRSEPPDFVSYRVAADDFVLVALHNISQ